MPQCAEHLYSPVWGLVPPEYMVPRGPGSPGQPKKFYVPLPLLPTVEFMDEEEVDALIEHHFKMGMSKFELGQFLITLGCKVNLTNFERQLLQHREWGMRQSEPSTGRRGTTAQVQQISHWRSTFGSKMGDPTPPHLLGGLDETILTMMIAQYRNPMFRKLYTLVKKFQVMLGARATSPAGLAISSMHLGVSAADYSQRAPAWEGVPARVRWTDSEPSIRAGI